jgi:hypothetical protein
VKKEKSCCTNQCCGAPQILDPPVHHDQNVDAPWVFEEIDSPIGKVPRIKTQLERTDTLGSVAVRLGINRNNYRVVPGLYAVGNPDNQSPVLVTANYKLTFDSLRKELANQNLWILTLDTNGINVWCAAGKGTFGTDELIKRINLVQLTKVISHKNIILPQLGAPGVAAHEVSKNTGLKVTYGPVYARDLPLFLSNELKATADMRKVHFTLKDRLTVIPVELNKVLKVLPILFILLFIFNLVSPGKINVSAVFMQSAYNLIPYAISIALGTIGIAALLPYIPFRSFAAKGLLLGLAWAALAVRYHGSFKFPDNTLIGPINILFLTSITSFSSLNFTGSTTYTSISGVQKEMLYTVPLIILAILLGLGLAITYKIMLFTG